MWGAGLSPALPSASWDTSRAPWAVGKSEKPSYRAFLSVDSRPVLRGAAVHRAAVPWAAPSELQAQPLSGIPTVGGWGGGR